MLIASRFIDSGSRCSVSRWERSFIGGENNRRRSFCRQPAMLVGHLLLPRPRRFEPLGGGGVVGFQREGALELGGRFGGAAQVEVDHPAAEERLRERVVAAE